MKVWGYSGHAGTRGLEGLGGSGKVGGEVSRNAWDLRGRGGGAKRGPGRGRQGGIPGDGGRVGQACAGRAGVSLLGLGEFFFSIGDFDLEDLRSPSQRGSLTPGHDDL